jgi:hypothetical protein
MPAAPRRRLWDEKRRISDVKKAPRKSPGFFRGFPSVVQMDQPIAATQDDEHGWNTPQQDDWHGVLPSLIVNRDL